MVKNLSHIQRFPKFIYLTEEIQVEIPKKSRAVSLIFKIFITLFTSMPTSWPTEFNFALMPICRQEPAEFLVSTKPAAKSGVDSIAFFLILIQLPIIDTT